jgi:PAS domain S-box-containing protein
MRDIAPIRVLLVEDDEDDYLITRDLISSIPGGRYELDWVNHYDAGLEAIRRRTHDIALVDFRLGAQTGLDLLRESRELGASLPILLLTGQGDREVDEEAMRAGAADYLVKGQLSADVLERAIRYANERRSAGENLRRERDLISRVMETSPVGILTLDRTGRITFANSQAEQLLGLAREAIHKGACHISECRFTALESGQNRPLSAPFDELRLSSQPVQGVRYALDRPGERRVILSLNATPLRDDSGAPDGSVITVEDITERLDLEAQLRQSQKMESVGQLAAGVAHDINNILTIILGHVGMLMAAAPPNSASIKPLWQVSAAAERAARFIRQLLMFSRRQVIQSRVLEVNAVLRGMGSLLPRMLGEDVIIETSYAADLPLVEADVGMLEQVVMNLAVNARDAMPKGGRLRLVTAVAEIDETYARSRPEARPGRFVHLSVSDTGCGMDAKVLARIFEPFFSTKEVGRGTGLGLATVYGIVKQHHGWIEVESQVGTGSQFSIFLPATDKAADQSAEPTVNLELIRGGRETILLVEDEHILRELVVTVLREYGYTVLEAPSGDAAIRVWDQHHTFIDLLLTDVVMPGGMNGYELARRLREQRPDLPVIYSSGYSAERTKEEIELDGYAFLPKPYLPRQVAQLVRQSLDGAITLEKSSTSARPVARRPQSCAA